VTGTDYFFQLAKFSDSAGPPPECYHRSVAGLQVRTSSSTTIQRPFAHRWATATGSLPRSHPGPPYHCLPSCTPQALFDQSRTDSAWHPSMEPPARGKMKTVAVNRHRGVQTLRLISEDQTTFTEIVFSISEILRFGWGLISREKAP
jgi:hypothetical protein